MYTLFVYKDESTLKFRHIMLLELQKGLLEIVGILFATIICRIKNIFSFLFD